MVYFLWTVAGFETTLERKLPRSSFKKLVGFSHLVPRHNGVYHYKLHVRWRWEDFHIVPSATMVLELGFVLEITRVRSCVVKAFLLFISVHCQLCAYKISELTCLTLFESKSHKQVTWSYEYSSTKPPASDNISGSILRHFCRSNLQRVEIVFFISCEVAGIWIGHRLRADAGWCGLWPRNANTSYWRSERGNKSSFVHWAFCLCLLFNTTVFEQSWGGAGWVELGNPKMRWEKCSWVTGFL